MEYWSVGCKNGKKSDFILLPLFSGDPNTVHIFPLFQIFIIPSLSPSRSPLLQYSGTPVLNNLLL
jgi:hypothetical protein